MASALLPPIVQRSSMETSSIGQPPHADMSPRQYVALVVAASLPAVVFVGLFSNLGAGPEVYDALQRLDSARRVAACAPAIALFAWFINISRRGPLPQLVVAIGFISSFAAALALGQRAMPSAPLCVYVIALPLWAMVIKQVVELPALAISDGHIEAYQLFAAGWRISLGVGGALVAAGALHDLAVALVPALDAGVELCLVSRGHPIALECERHLFMWAFPYVCACAHGIYAIALYALVDADREDERLFVRVVVVVATLVLGGVWLGAELAGVAYTASRIITMLAVSSLGGTFLAVLLYLRALDADVVEHGAALERQLGRDLSTHALNWSHFKSARLLRDSASEFLNSAAGDWVWALLLLSPAPPLFALYAGADVVRCAAHRVVHRCQAHRRAAAGGAAAAAAGSSEEWDGVVSAWTARRLRELSGLPADMPTDAPRGGWLAYQLRTVRAPNLSAERERAFRAVGKDWSSVLSKAILIQLAFVLLNVGIGKVTMILLAALIDALAGVPLTLVLGAFWAVGLFLFLLPPVPGVPVYLTGGLMITASARASLGYAGALALATATCFLLKLTACFVQQEGIGRYLSRFVVVRQALAVNSRQTRAIKAILSRPGLTARKACVLVGGPDWPTSVLAGVLRCNVWQCLLGTTPAILVIAPQCAVGALQGPDPPVSARTSSIALAAASAIAVLPLLGAMAVINEALSDESAAALGAEPYVDEVLELEQAEAEARAYYATATHWCRHKLRAVDTPPTHKRTAGYFPLQHDAMLRPIPLSARAALVCGWLAAWGSVSLEQLKAEQCFVPFEITSSIEHDLGGNAFNVVKPLGWVVLALSATSCACVVAFRTWGRFAAAQLAAQLAAKADEWCVHVQTHADVVAQPASRQMWENAQLELQLIQRKYGGRGRKKRASSSNMLEFYVEQASERHSVTLGAPHSPEHR
ncbi:hypothetical protein KFE25_013463 [Diacronema lutheri]|uniref:Uncharacterized protein n=1 Tax=Diacronema lutheri TaxID=2081491 RepID=A0A8J6CFU8_DIALT|nr:hypothetical protein KFE25_013463 [Diacronema lutheri]